MSKVEELNKQIEELKKQLDKEILREFTLYPPIERLEAMNEQNLLNTSCNIQELSENTQVFIDEHIDSSIINISEIIASISDEIAILERIAEELCNLRIGYVHY